ncbi:MAG TPA: formate dehydrogenase accessory protein FdhE [Chloroflexota bacterium]
MSQLWPRAADPAHNSRDVSATLHDTMLALLERRVAALRRSRPGLDQALTLQQAIIRTQLSSSRPPAVSLFPLPRQHVVARVQDGVPLLHEQPVTVDVHYAADLFTRLVQALSPRFDSLIGPSYAGRLDHEHLFGEAFVQHADHLAQIARDVEVDAELLGAAATLSVAPSLRAYAARLLPLVQQAETSDNASWTRGYCPICGGWPLLAELRGVDHAYWLRCAACGSGWAGDVTRCPYCGNSDSRTRATLTLDGEQRFHVAACEHCKGYLKVGSALQPPPTELLAIDDVAGLHFDLAALERGFRRPPGSGYRIELAMPDDEWVEEIE